MGDTWTPDNTDAKYPRLRSSGTINGNNNYTQSDFWLYAGGGILASSEVESEWMETGDKMNTMRSILHPDFISK